MQRYQFVDYIFHDNDDNDNDAPTIQTEISEIFRGIIRSGIGYQLHQ